MPRWEKESRDQPPWVRGSRGCWRTSPCSDARGHWARRNPPGRHFTERWYTWFGCGKTSPLYQPLLLVPFFSESEATPPRKPGRSHGLSWGRGRGRRSDETSAAETSSAAVYHELLPPFAEVWSTRHSTCLLLVCLFKLTVSVTSSAKPLRKDTLTICKNTKEKQTSTSQIT